jgi:beta-glucuronidase
MLYPQMNEYRTVVDLSGFWEFQPDPSGRGEKEAWFKKDLPQSKKIAVPGSWNEQFQSADFENVDIKNYLGDSWYQRKVFIPAEWARGNIFLRIGAANYRAKVWLNDVYLGEHEGGFLPFQFNIVSCAYLGRENTVTIKVNNELDASTIPQGIDEEIAKGKSYPNYPPTGFDFFPYAGLHRPVLLYTTPRSFIEDIRIKTEITGKSGLVSYEIMTNGKVEKVRTQLLQPDGKKVSEIVQEKEGEFFQGVFLVKRASFWSPENPYLYNFKVEILKKEEVADSYTLPVGIRTVEIKDCQLLLNQKPIYLKGFGKHEDFPIVGKGLCLPLIRRDFSLLKWIGANSFRTSHYPYAEEILQLADEEGFLVINEVPAVSLSFKSVNEKTLTTHQKMLTELIARDKNHPSVIIWSVANEPDVNIKPSEKPSYQKSVPYFKKLAKLVKKLDPTRLTTVVVCQKEDYRFLKYYDLASWNQYLGWYRFPAQLEKAVKELSRDLDVYYRKLKKPLFITEFGADAVAGLHSVEDELFTEEYQAKMIELYCRVFRTKKYIVGEHPWNFADFKTAQSIHRIIVNRKGVFTRLREPKLAAHILKKIWQGK